MDNSNIKKRDVWTFDEFVKSTDEASKSIMLKKGENPHPGGHTITAESAYVRNDANPYKAAGIKYNEDEANINDRMNANRVHLFDPNKNNRVEVITGGKTLGENAGAAIDTIINGMQSGVIIDESAEYKLEDLERNISKDDEKVY